MKSKLAVFLCAFSSTLSYAVPSMYSDEFPSLNIINDTNSTLIRDNKREDLVWVLPPTAGEASLVGFSSSSNIRLCSGLKSLTAASKTSDRLTYKKEGGKLPPYLEPKLVVAGK